MKQQPENVCESVTRGTRVVVTTRLKQRSYATKAGEKRTVYEVEGDDVASSLKFASAKMTKVSRSHADSGAARSSTGQGRGADADP